MESLSHRIEGLEIVGLVVESMSEKEPKANQHVRLRDRERTQSEILNVAIEEFGQRGFLGARIDQIASLTRTTKRMIYYYFGSKEGLYVAALDFAYRQVVVPVEHYEIDGLAPLEAFRKIVTKQFDLHENFPWFARLISLENMNEAKFLNAETGATPLPRPLIEVMQRLLDEGHQDGSIKRDVDATDVWMMISSLCFFRVNNRFTFSVNFKRDLLTPERHDYYRTMIAEVVVAYLSTN